STKVHLQDERPGATSAGASASFIDPVPIYEQADNSRCLPDLQIESAESACAKQDLIEHLKNTKRIHEKDLREGAGRTTLPDAIARKYPNADSQWGWQFVFPA